MEIKSTVNEVVGVANEVRGFWSKLFGAKQDTPKPVAKKKEKYVAVDETHTFEKKKKNLRVCMTLMPT